MKISIKQLSEMSGFSPATVSNVLNGKKGVNKDTAELIMKLARESGYLSENRMTSIKLVVYKKHGWVLSDTPFFSSLTEGVNEECRASGYDTVICNLNEHSEDFESHLEQIAAEYGVRTTARLPIDPAIAKACDGGAIETLDQTYLEGLAPILTALG